MAITVVTTAGAANANSYVATSYVDSSAEETTWEASWSGKTADEKNQLVVRATKAIDRLHFRGYPTNEDQALLWPRTNAYKASGLLWDSDVVPAPIEKATAHVAAWLASKTSDPFIPPSDDNVKRNKKVDVLGEVEYFGPQKSEGDRFLAHIIVPMLEGHGLVGAAGTVKLTR